LSRWLIAWVGDCRIYRLRATHDGPAELLTRDDTYRHLGERPPPGGSPDDPARMVGNGAIADPNVAGVELGDGEMLVLCSDGLHKHVEPQEINRQLRADGSLVRCCTRLIELARAHGTHDDATVLVIHRLAQPEQAPR
jgi:protein phosphatase